MKRSMLYVAALAVLFAMTTSYAPEVQAAKQFSTLIDYWASPSVHNGSYFQPCSGNVQTTGTQSGEWKEITYTDCHTDEVTYEVWHYCSGTWVQVAYLGDPSC